MQRSRLQIVICAAVLLIGLLYYFYAGSTPPAGQPDLVRLNAGNFGQLRRAFNAASDSTRIIALLSPT